jgi:O-antigen ligase
VLKDFAEIRKIKPSFWLFAAVFFTCTWDLLFKLEVAGFTLKLYQPLALVGLLVLFWEKRHQGINHFLAPLFAPFPAAFLVLGIYYLALSPWSVFPLKSALYSIWLFFQIIVVYLAAQHIRKDHPQERILRLVWTTLLFLSYVILVDYVYYYFGFKAGLIGWNQDKITGLGLSRPHAFSSEPSFAASFMSLALLSTAVPLFLKVKRKWAFLLSLLIILFATFATTSRTGWVCLGLGSLFLCLVPVLQGKKVQWKLFGLLAGLAPIVIGAFVATTPPAQRQVMMDSFVNSIFKGNDSSGNSRIKALGIAWKFASETGWLGTGFAAHYKYFLDRGGKDYHEDFAWNPEQYGNEMIMSIWGQLLAEGGPIAVLIYLTAGLILLRSLFLQWRKNQDNFAMCSMVACFIFFFFAAFWLGNVNRGDIWIWFGIWSAASKGYSG